MADYNDPLGLNSWLEKARARHAALTPEYRAQLAAYSAEREEARQEYEDTHCSECGHEWCCCDDARDMALSPVRVTDLGEGWARAAA